MIVRLALVGCLGGVALTAGLGWVEYRAARQLEATRAANRFAQSVRQLRHTLAPALTGNERDAASQVLYDIVEHPDIVATRLRRPGWAPLTAGPWQSHTPGPEAHAPAADSADASTADDPFLRAFLQQTPTLFTFELGDGDQPATLMLLTDGSAVHQLAVRRAVQNAAASWVPLGLVMLVGLLFVRTWLTQPLNKLIGLAASDANAEQFVIAAARTGGELGVLASSIGAMLRRLDHTARQLHQREAELDHLYQHAPMAVVSVDNDGAIRALNDRAAELFAAPDPSAMTGLSILDYLHPGDRARFRQRVDELEVQADTRLALRMSLGGRVREFQTHMMAIERRDGGPREIRLSFADVTEARRIAREAEEHRRLLDLVIDHMADSVLLVNPEGRIISANTPLERLLGVGRPQLVGERHDPAALWTPLEPIDTEAFERKTEAAARRPDQPFEGRFECAVGAYQIQATPVTDEDGTLLAQLWLVRDVSYAVENRRLLDQREAQLQAIRRIGRELHEATSVNDLLERSVTALRDVIGVEAAGVALRGRRGEARCRLLADDGQPCVGLLAGRALRDGVVEAVMPRVLTASDSSFWPDLASAGPWAEPLVRAGLETLAVAPLKAGGQTQGVAWIARRGGERIEPHQLYVLEAVGPILSTAVLNAELREDLRDMAMTDPLTELPSFGQFEWLARRLAVRQKDWALLFVDVDRFRRLNDRLGVSAANAALRAVATLLRETCRSIDQPIRHSGDKFLLVCPATTIDEARTLAHRVHQTLVDTPLQLDGESVAITCSIGVAAGRGPQTVNTLLDAAQARLRVAQARGRNLVVADDHPTEAAG